MKRTVPLPVDKCELIIAESVAFVSVWGGADTPKLAIWPLPLVFHLVYSQTNVIRTYIFDFLPLFGSIKTVSPFAHRARSPVVIGPDS